jgi:predicted phosphodiesterase
MKGIEELKKKTEKLSKKEIDLINDDIVDEFNHIIDRDDPTKGDARREAEEFLREELAKLMSFKKIYGTTKDFVKSIKYKNDAETLVIVISDWHVGKVIKDEKGKVIYDSAIAVKIMTDVFATRILKLIKRVGAHTNIDEVVIILAGDLIENEIIYETQVHHIDLPAVQQKNEAVRALIKFISSIETAFELLGQKGIRIRIEGVTGNHGRTGLRTSEESSWDIAIMSELDLVFSIMKKENIIVDFSLVPYKTVNIRGHKGLVRHTAPVQADTPAGRAKFGGWHEMFNYDFLIYGHYHHYGIYPFNGVPIFRNGSICGTDDLAVEMAVRDRPCQLMFGINEQEIPTFMYKVNLD